MQHFLSMFIVYRSQAWKDLNKQMPFWTFTTTTHHINEFQFQKLTNNHNPSITLSGHLNKGWLLQKFELIPKGFLFQRAAADTGEVSIKNQVIDCVAWKGCSTHIYAWTTHRMTKISNKLYRCRPRRYVQMSAHILNDCNSPFSNKTPSKNNKRTLKSPSSPSIIFSFTGSKIVTLA